MLHHQLITNPKVHDYLVFVHGAGGSSNVWYKQIRSFSRLYNLLLVDLRGHGLSAMQHTRESDSDTEKIYTFRGLAQDVIEVLDAYRLRRCHFIGLSLGTIIIREIAEIDRSYVRTMILAGAILQLDLRTRLMSRAADWFKRFIPYMTLYKFYAYLIMPHPAHRRSRLIFINSAMKITHDEFLNWMTLNRNLDRLLRFRDHSESAIPTLYIMGENDYVFLSQVRMQLKKHHRNSFLYIVPQAGHICNIDNSRVFNAVTRTFLRDCGSDAD